MFDFMSVCAIVGLYERMVGYMVIWLQSFSLGCSKQDLAVRLFVFMTNRLLVFSHTPNKKWLVAVIRPCVFVLVHAAKKHVVSE